MKQLSIKVPSETCKVERLWIQGYLRKGLIEYITNLGKSLMIKCILMSPLLDAKRKPIAPKRGYGLTPCSLS